MADLCNAFAWIGQPITSCDNCGRPIWFHDYNDRREGPAPFPPRLIGTWLRQDRIDARRAIEMLSVGLDEAPATCTSSPADDD